LSYTVTFIVASNIDICQALPEAGYKRHVRACGLRRGQRVAGWVVYPSDRAREKTLKTSTRVAFDSYKPSKGWVNLKMILYVRSILCRVPPCEHRNHDGGAGGHLDGQVAGEEGEPGLILLGLLLLLRRRRVEEQEQERAGHEEGEEGSGRAPRS